MKTKFVHALLPLLLATASLLPAQVTLLVDPATPVPDTIAEGGNFTFDLQLENMGASASTDIVSYSYSLRSVVAAAHTAASNIFTLQSLAITSPVLTEANTSPLGTPLVLDPQAGAANQPTDLGAITPTSTASGLGAGTFEVEALSFSVAANATPGVYQLEFYEPGPSTNPYLPVGIYDDNFNGVGTDTGPIFTADITVVPGEVTIPEPGSGALLLLGAVVTLGLTRRRLRA